MQKFNIKKQVRKLYGITAIGCLHIAGASWVVLLEGRGFSLIEIGIIESIFMLSVCVLRFRRELQRMYLGVKRRLL